MRPFAVRAARSPHRLRAVAAAVAAALPGLAGAPAFAADYTWTTGYHSASGLPTTIGTGDTLSIAPGGYKYLDRGLSTAGLVTWSDSLYFVNGNTIANTGTWTTSSADGFYDGGYGGIFDNAGVFRRTGAGTTTLGTNVAFVNSGIVDAQGGSFYFGGGSATFNAGSQFTGAGAVRIASNASFNGAYTSQNLVLEGGSFNGGSAVAAGVTRLTGGSFTGSWELGSGHQLSIEGGGYKYVNGSVTNKGSVSAADWLYLQNGNSFTNQGSYSIAGFGLADGGYGGSFVNAGSFVKAAGADTTVQGIAFVNSGSVAVAGGSLFFDSGNASFNAGSSFTGAGQSVVRSNASFAGAIQSANLVLAGGNFNGNGAVYGGTVRWTGGSFTGSSELASGATLRASGGSGYLYVNGSLTNRGTIAATDWIYFQNGNTLTNAGLLDLQANTGLGDGGYGGTVVNDGVLRKSAGGGDSSIQGIQFVNNAEIRATDGRLVFNSGSLQFNDGSRFTGSSDVVMNAAATFVGGFTTEGNLVLAAGQLQGGNASPGSKGIMNGSVRWTGGTLAGNWEVAAGRTLLAQGGSGYLYVNGIVANRGTLAATDWIYLQNGNALVNAGVHDFRADVGVGDGGYGGTFTNDGVLRKSAGSGDSTIQGVGVVNNGQVDVQSGRIVFASGASQFNAGSSFTGTGTAVVTANAMFVGGYTTAGNLQLASGNFQGGTGSAGSVGTMGGPGAGDTRWTGGTLTGTWVVAPGTTLAAAGGTGYLYVNGSVANQGTVRSTDSIYLQNASSFTNAGRHELQGDVGVGDGGYNGFYVNEGLLVKAAGTGTSSLAGIMLQNTAAGTVRVDTGTVQLPDGFNNAGLLTGSGAFGSGGPGLVNAGRVAPGNGLGTLAINGSFTQLAGGSLEIEVNALDSHDLLRVDGNLALGGTLAVSCYAACSYAVGDTIVVMDYTGLRSGSSFGALTTSGFGTGAFSIVYDDVGHRVLLAVTESVTPVPEPGAWAMWLAGLSVLGGLAARRRQAAA